MKNLPQEVIVEILLRLPVKSLLRFKCVSKYWQSLISDTHFAKLHFERVSTSTDYDRILYVIAKQFRSIDFNSSLHDDSAVVNLDFSIIPPPHSIRIFGSCRGFLLLVFGDDDELFLWNPATNACKPIPPSATEQPVILYGVAYDPSADDFLVVQAFSEISEYTITHFEIFSLRNNLWEKLELEDLTFSYARKYDRSGTLFNGAIHWVVMRDDVPELSQCTIIALDLASKNLRELSMPDDVFDEYRYLAVLRGCLGLIDLNADAGTVDIWVMKEYGVKSSWTSSFFVSLHDIPTPICFTKSGEVIAEDIGVLVKYNDKGELLEHREFCGYRSVYWSVASAYTESLLSLPGCDL